jgi:hypothetical protein
VVVGALALLGVFGASHPQKAFSQSSFVFDSRYEDGRAEEVAFHEAMAREERAEDERQSKESPQQEEEREGIGGNFGLKSEHCTVIPPPPDATRMVCQVSIKIEEKHEHRPTTREINVWAVEVLIDPHTGALTAHLSKLST